MKVVLVPGSRNEELINRIKQIKTAYPDEAWEQLQEYEETEEFFDALFYATSRICAMYSDADNSYYCIGTVSAEFR